MRILSISTHRFSPDQIARFLRFVYRRVAGRPDCAVVAGSLSTALTALRAAIDRVEQSAEDRALGTAELEYLDGVLDAELASFVRFLVALLGGRQHPSFIRLFPVAPSTITEGMGTVEQSNAVAAVLEAFRSDPTLQPLAGQAAQVQSALTAVDDCRARREAARVAEGVAAGQLTVALNDAVTAYNSAFHLLSASYPGERGLVRSFFPEVSSKPRANAAEALESD